MSSRSYISCVLHTYTGEGEEGDEEEEEKEEEKLPLSSRSYISCVLHTYTGEGEEGDEEEEEEEEKLPSSSRSYISCVLHTCTSSRYTYALHFKNSNACVPNNTPNNCVLAITSTIAILFKTFHSDVLFEY